MNEQISRVRTPETVGAEIRNLTSAARYLNVYYAVEIGRRLTEAKELVAHGEWLNWLKTETEFSQPTANRFMRVFAEYGAEQGSLFGAETKYSTLNNLSVSNALRLLAVPEEEREAFAAEVDAEHLSTKELEEAIRERDEARKALQTSEARLADAQRTISDSDKQLTDLRQRLQAAKEDVRAADDQATENERILKERIRELEARPIDVAVQEPDPAEIERRVQEATEAARAEKAAAEEKLAEELAEEKEKARAAADKLRAQLKVAEEKLATAGAEDRAAAERARAEVDSLKKQLAMSGEAMIKFKLHFAAWQHEYQECVNAMMELPEEQLEKCRAAIRAQAEKWAAAE